MRIEEVGGDVPEGEKRQYLPVVIHWTCPECGEEKKTDFREQYIAYPEWGEQYEYPVFCTDCDELEPIRELTFVPRLTIAQHSQS